MNKIATIVVTADDVGGRNEILDAIESALEEDYHLDTSKEGTIIVSSLEEEEDE